jgi:hypothetical protein
VTFLTTTTESPETPSAERQYRGNQHPASSRSFSTLDLSQAQAYSSESVLRLDGGLETFSFVEPYFAKPCAAAYKRFYEAADGEIAC